MERYRCWIRKKKVIGIITDRDICLALNKKQVKKLPAEITVGDIMSPKVITVSADDTLDTALRLMRTNRIGRLPVTEKNGKLKGVMSLHMLISHSLARGSGLGKISAKGENILKTIQALTARYISPASLDRSNAR